MFRRWLPSALLCLLDANGDGPYLNFWTGISLGISLLWASLQPGRPGFRTGISLLAPPFFFSIFF